MLMEELVTIINEKEEELMERILNYAKRQGYAAYTSTLKEPWRLSVAGLSASVTAAVRNSSSIPEMKPDEDFISDPIAQFGIVEAQRHRERGVDLGMFLGLMKYYRQSYLDLIEEMDLHNDVRRRYQLFLNRVFDRIEVGFCVEWSGRDEKKVIHDLQVSNRLMTNEKNKYLTIYESIPNPVIMLSRFRKIENMNLAAARLFRVGVGSGEQYYCSSRDRQLESEEAFEEGGNAQKASYYTGSIFYNCLDFIKTEVNQFFDNSDQIVEFETSMLRDEKETIFRVKLSKILDVSNKFDGVLVILEDITSLRNALDEVKTLKGFIPICANCKNIRNDQGYWQKVEQYVQEHSEAQFSHGICPDCARQLYPEYYVEKDLSPKEGS